MEWDEKTLRFAISLVCEHDVRCDCSPTHPQCIEKMEAFDKHERFWPVPFWFQSHNRAHSADASDVHGKAKASKGTSDSSCVSSVSTKLPSAGQGEGPGPGGSSVQVAQLGGCGGPDSTQAPEMAPNRNQDDSDLTQVIFNTRTKLSCPVFDLPTFEELIKDLPESLDVLDNIDLTEDSFDVVSFSDRVEATLPVVQGQSQRSTKGQTTDQCAQTCAKDSTGSRTDPDEPGRSSNRDGTRGLEETRHTDSGARGQREGFRGTNQPAPFPCLGDGSLSFSVGKTENVTPSSRTRQPETPSPEGELQEEDTRKKFVGLKGTKDVAFGRIEIQSVKNVDLVHDLKRLVAHVGERFAELEHQIQTLNRKLKVGSSGASQENAEKEIGMIFLLEPDHSATEEASRIRPNRRESTREQQLESDKGGLKSEVTERQQHRTTVERTDEDVGSGRKSGPVGNSGHDKQTPSRVSRAFGSGRQHNVSLSTVMGRSEPAFVTGVVRGRDGAGRRRGETDFEMSPETGSEVRVKVRPSLKRKRNGQTKTAAVTGKSSTPSQATNSAFGWKAGRPKKRPGRPRKQEVQVQKSDLLREDTATVKKVCKDENQPTKDGVSENVDVKKGNVRRTARTHTMAGQSYQTMVKAANDTSSESGKDGNDSSTNTESVDSDTEIVEIVDTESEEETNDEGETIDTESTENEVFFRTVHKRPRRN